MQYGVVIPERAPFVSTGCGASGTLRLFAGASGLPKVPVGVAGSRRAR